MSVSFQTLRGSSIRLSSRRVCSSGLTSSQYLRRMMPESTIAFSTSGTAFEEASGLLVGAEAHDPLDAGAVVPAAIEDHDLARCGEVRDVALDVHLRLLALGRRREGDDPERPRAHPLGDRLDRAALAGGVPALEHDADLGARGLHPLLHRHELAVQQAELVLVLLALHLRRAGESSDPAGVDGLGIGCRRPGASSPSCSCASCSWCFFLAHWSLGSLVGRSRHGGGAGSCRGDRPLHVDRRSTCGRLSAADPLARSR